MKKIFFLFLLSCSVWNTSAQAPSIVWEKSYGGTRGDFPYDMVATHNGKIAICGSSNSVNYDLACNTDSLNLDYWFFCIDTLGDLLWSRCYGGSGNDEASGIDTTNDGGFVVVGYTNSYDGDVIGNHGSGDYWFLKLDSLGNIQWSKCYGGSATDIAFDVMTTSDGGYLISGESRSNDGDVTGHHGVDIFLYDYWIIKIDSVGILQWQHSLGGSDNDYAMTGIEFSKNKYLVGGSADSNNGDVTLPIGGGDFWIVMLDSIGNIIWEHSYGGSGGDQCRKILKTVDGKILLCGPSNSNNFQVTDNHGGEEYLVIEIDSFGNFQWAHAYGGIGQEYLRNAALTPDGGFVAIGMSQNSAGTGQVSQNYGNDDYWVIKADENGNLQWEKNFGGSDYDHGNSIVVYRNSIFFSGISASSDHDVTYNHNNGTADGWTAMLAGYTAIPFVTAYKDFLLWPNPADQTVTIKLFNCETCELVISDLSGFDLLHSSFTFNNNLLKIDVSSFHQGTYLITLKTDNRKFYTQKLFILHS